MKIIQLNQLTIEKITSNRQVIVKKFKYNSGHIVELTPHSLKRVSGRKGEKKKNLFENTAVKVAHLFCAKIGIEGFRGVKSRVAIRFNQENVIVILSLDSMASETEYTVAVATVWNMNLGEFFFRNGMPIYDMSFSFEKGFEVQGAPINSYTVQEKFYWER